MPGGVAFHTHNRVIAADFLTGNRRTYARMRSSGNALDTLFKIAEDAGHPVDYFVYVGGDFITWNREAGDVAYIDPKMGGSRAVIGHMHLGKPWMTHVGGKFAIWKLR
jgi:hypothetical protein